MVSKKDLEMPLWVLDGFVGILALTIYNFSLYLLAEIGIGGTIAKMNDAMGYFGLNSFLDFGFEVRTMMFGLTLMFAFSFFLGITIGHWVRRKKKI